METVAEQAESAQQVGSGVEALALGGLHAIAKLSPSQLAGAPRALEMIVTEPDGKSGVGFGFDSGFRPTRAQAQQ